jgi:acyl-CoA reductase-like NAD-dependent aldehyde dehydrogenase
MTTTLAPPSRATTSDIDRSLDALSKGHARLAKASATELVRLAEECIEGTARMAREWVDMASRYKGVASGNPLRAEEISAGPVATIRQLRLVIQSLQEINQFGKPRLPGQPTTGPDRRLRVPVFPAKGMFDGITFQGFQVDAWMKAGVTQESLRLCPDGVPGRWNADNPRICLVLGAGNVSSIPTTDAFTKLFQEGRTVLLKMNPVNESLGPIFEKAYAPLIDAGFLRIIYGGAEVGAAAVGHALVDEVHITGSIYSHDAIVWGPAGAERERRKRENDPVLRKPITSELGNVTPWIIVPGEYSEKQLDFQAANVATSITNNCSFNCIATKVIVTSANWPDRDRFLDKVARILGRIAPRKAYYPGAAERFTRFSGLSTPTGSDTLPWTLLRNVSPQASPHFFKEESFVCVSVETPLEAGSDTAFLDRAVDFANNELWGTLAASITLPADFRKDATRESSLQAALSRLNYGTIAINQWSGLSFAMMSPAWGGVAGSRLDDAQSGIGWVHNTYMLDGIEKNVLTGPLTVSPKPLWFATHSNPEAVAWRLLDLYHKPSVWKLASLLGSAVRHGR